MYEPITVNVDRVDRGQGDGAYSSTPISFAGRLLRTVEGDHTAMRLYEWADRGRLAYLVHVVEADKPGRPPDAPSTRSSTPTRPCPPPRRATPPRRFLGPTRSWSVGGSGGRRVARDPRDLGPSLRPYSPECVEGLFSEVRTGFR